MRWGWALSGVRPLAPTDATRTMCRPSAGDIPTLMGCARYYRTSKIMITEMDRGSWPIDEPVEYHVSLMDHAR